MYRKLLRRLAPETFETAIARWMKDLVPDPRPNDSLLAMPCLVGMILLGALVFSGMTS
jgi:hypothetical protein